MFPFALFFALGCALASYFPIFSSWWWIAMVGAVLITFAECVFLFIGKHTRSLVIASMITALLLGIAACHIRNPLTNDNHFSHHIRNGHDVSMVVQLSEELQRTPKKQKATARVCAIEQSDGLVKTSGTTIVYFDSTASLSEGMRVLVRGRITTPPDSLGAKGFNYRRYLQHKGIFLQCFVDDYQVLCTLDRPITSRWREQVDHVIEKSNLSDENVGIAKAMLLGDKKAPLDITKDEFRRAGISHLLCVSGLHVGIVAALVALLLRPFGRGRRALIFRSVAEIGVVWLFVLMTGAAPSTLRAGVMFSFIIAAAAISGRTPVLNALGASALVLLVWRPAMVADVGFQLSYSAVAGIMVLASPLSRVVPWGRFKMPSGGFRRKVTEIAQKLLRRIWQYVAVCLSAQVFTMPLVIYYFGYVSPWFLVGNLLIVPFAGLLLASLMVMMAASRWPWGWQMMQTVVEWELTAVCETTHWIACL